MNKRPQLFIFDLDGVLTDTANYHYLAWKKLADDLGYHFDREINERLKGVSRIRSFEIILEVNEAQDKYTEQEKEVLANKKNDMYVELINEVTQEDILPGIEKFLRQAKSKGMEMAVASASKNAFAVLERLGIKGEFDYIADARLIKHAKPHPEVFLDCAKKLDVEPKYCIGFEDAEAGVEAIHAGGMFSVGINVVSDKIKPNLALEKTSQLDFDTVVNAYKEWAK